MDGELSEPEKDPHRLATLKAYVLPRSVEQTDWSVAAQEWYCAAVEVKDHGVCVCGQTPIHRHCHIKNRLNGGEIVVGSSCVDRFGGDLAKQVRSVFSSLQRIRKDPKVRASAELLDMAQKQGIASEADATLYRLVLRKRNLEAGELDTIARVNKAIVDAMGATTEQDDSEE